MIILTIVSIILALGFFIASGVADTRGKTIKEMHLRNDSQGGIIDMLHARLMELEPLQKHLHKCKHCGVMTTQSDDECWNNPKRILSPKEALSKITDIIEHVSFGLIMNSDQNIYMSRTGEADLKSFTFKE